MRSVKWHTARVWEREIKEKRDLLRRYCPSEQGETSYAPLDGDDVSESLLVDIRHKDANHSQRDTLHEYHENYQAGLERRSES